MIFLRIASGLTGAELRGFGAGWVLEYDVIVVGGGAAGLLAGARCAERGLRTAVLEKNRKPGVKILMSGGTRCNITQDTDAKGIMAAFGRNGRFLHTALSALGPSALVALIEGEGVATKVEETGKVFPRSDRALDVQQALLRRLSRSGAELRLDSPVAALTREEGGFRVRVSGGEMRGRAVILATGGCSYPGCGTTGDGYPWLRSFGHTVVAPRPALVPLTTDVAWVRSLSGLTLSDVEVSVVRRDALNHRGEDWSGRVSQVRRRRVDARRGSLLFTHFGLSGPAVLDVSRTITAAEPGSVEVVIDLRPDRSLAELEAELDEACGAHGGRSLGRIFGEMLPQSLAQSLLEEWKLPRDQRSAEVSRNLRRRICAMLKTVTVPIRGTRGFAKAEVTAGGVSLKEVDSRTMESKLVPGLFVVGEVLDLDGWIGGYNFQSAFSTSWLAAESIG